MYRKKNKVLTFLFTLLPGAAEMYMGFMKMGMTLLSLFIGSLAIASWLGMGFFVYFALVVWIYSFFHGINLSSLPDEQFAQMEDTYLISLSFMEDDRVRKVTAAALILLGVLLCYNAACNVIYTFYPGNAVSYLLRALNPQIIRAFIGIAVIIAGVAMICGKKKELDEEEKEDGKRTGDEN